MCYIGGVLCRGLSVTRNAGADKGTANRADGHAVPFAFRG